MKRQVRTPKTLSVEQVIAKFEKEKPLMLKLALIEAEIKANRYEAYLVKGFSAAQAFELCKL